VLFLQKKDMTTSEFQDLVWRTVKTSKIKSKDIALKVYKKNGEIGVSNAIVSRAINKCLNTDTHIRIEIMRILTDRVFFTITDKSLEKEYRTQIYESYQRYTA